MFLQKVISKVQRVRELIPETMEMFTQKKPEGKGLPINAGDSNFSVHRGELTVVFAGPLGGSTAFLLSRAVHLAARRDIPVMYYSFNLSKTLLAERMLALHSGLKFNLKPEKGDWPVLASAAGALSEAALYVEDEQMDIDQLDRSIKKIVREKKIQLIVVDGIDSIGYLYDSIPAALRVKKERACARLKKLAVSLNVAIMGVVKIDSESKILKEPTLNMEDSGFFQTYKKESSVVRFADTVAVVNISWRDPSGSLFYKNKYSSSLEHSHLNFDRASMKCSFGGETDV